jgi:hypothetical protein
MNNLGYMMMPMASSIFADFALAKDRSYAKER